MPWKKTSVSTSERVAREKTERVFENLPNLISCAFGRWHPSTQSVFDYLHDSLAELIIRMICSSDCRLLCALNYKKNGCFLYLNFNSQIGGLMNINRIVLLTIGIILFIIGGTVVYNCNGFLLTTLGILIVWSGWHLAIVLGFFGKKQLVIEKCGNAENIYKSTQNNGY
jgi:hypothetical protein